MTSKGLGEASVAVERGLQGAPGTASAFAWLEWLRQLRFYKCGVPFMLLSSAQNMKHLR